MICNETHVICTMNNISAAFDWGPGVPFVGGRSWGCVGLPLAPAGTTVRPRPLPFYRRIQDVSVDRLRNTVVVSTKDISIFDIFHGTIQVKHSPATMPTSVPITSSIATPQVADQSSLDMSPPLEQHRQLDESSGSCSDYDGDCGACLRASEPGDLYIFGICFSGLL